jgi:hypothetical protein
LQAGYIEARKSGMLLAGYLLLMTMPGGDAMINPKIHQPLGPFV